MHSTPAGDLEGVPDRPDYNWDVRPILSDNCFRCHGINEKARQASLRLDDPAVALAELKEMRGHYAIVPGHPEQSEIIRRITSSDPKVHMPPPELHKTLSDHDVAVLRRWISQGAKYEPFWALVPPLKVLPPATKAENRVVNDIDRFVFARLDREGLSPSPEADRATLINRVSLTLTGLPPSLEDVDAFVNDKDPNAYEKLVDRLLASPAYGERMAAYWLNVARYADTDGFLDDHGKRLLWPWRDWMISAFNKNMPYDQFVTWQLAGDLLPHATKDQVLATTFLRLGKRSTENGAIDEEYHMEYALDRANTVGIGLLGLTVQCARCHDHKYDPISQKDYYSLTAFFNSIDEPGFYAPGGSGITAGPTMPWTDREQDAKLAEAESAIQAARANYEAAEAAAAPAVAGQVDALLRQPSDAVGAAIMKSIDAATVAYLPFETTSPIPPDKMPTRPPVSVPRETDPTALDGPVLPARPNARPARLPGDWVPDQMVFTPNLAAPDSPAVLQDALLKPGVKGNALWLDDTNKGFLPNDIGRYDRTHPFGFDLWVCLGGVYSDSTIVNERDDENAGGAGYQLDLENNVLVFDIQHSRPYNMISVITKKPLPVKKWEHISVTYDGSSKASGVKLYLNGELADVAVRRDNLTASSLTGGPTQVFDPWVGFSFGKRHKPETIPGSALDELRVFDRALTPIEVAYLDKEGAALQGDRAALRRQLEEMVAANDPSVVKAGQALTDAREAQNRIASTIPQIMVMRDSPTPRNSYVLLRGLYDQHGDQVQPNGINAVLPWNDSWPRNRLGLARWLFDPKNPLTARVMVNRLWQLDFGKGIVDTPDDFGMQGSNPTNPELLDWLAVDFMQSGWDIKRLQKMIVMSAAFRQSSDVNQELLQLDPQNRLLARGPRFRLPSEMVRDSALFAGGLLVDKIGGPSVFPYQPDGIWSAGASEDGAYPAPSKERLDDLHRRSIYTYVKRNIPPADMITFDMNDRSYCSTTITISNTPLQALVLLDDPQYVEAYRGMATRALKASSDPDRQIEYVYRLAIRRRPNSDELNIMRQFYEEEAARFRQSPADRDKFLSIGLQPVDPSVDRVQLAALASVAEAVMNTPDADTLR